MASGIANTSEYVYHTKSGTANILEQQRHRAGPYLGSSVIHNKLMPKSIPSLPQHDSDLAHPLMYHVGEAAHWCGAKNWGIIYNGWVM